jgi:serine/threonine-protein kinase RsbW
MKIQILPKKDCMYSPAKNRPVPNEAQYPNDHTLLCSAPSDLGTIEGMCKLVRHFLVSRNLADLLFGTEIVVRECLNNAVLHGNMGNQQKRLSLAVVAECRRVTVRITDEGRGFDWRMLPVAVPDSSSSSGRGLAMVRLYATRVAFNPAGNQITVELDSKPARRAKK